MQYFVFIRDNPAMAESSVNDSVSVRRWAGQFPAPSAAAYQVAAA